MLEVLQFVFSSFWVWLGTLVLISCAGGAIRNIFSSVAESWKKAKKGK